MDGKKIVEIASTRLNQNYVLGAKVPKNNPNWNGPWDCAELASWALYQATGILFGTKPLYNPAQADAYTGYWSEQAHSAHATISVSDAARIPGAFVLREPHPATKTGGHIVISDGNGGTVEAHSSKDGVICNTLNGRRWDCGILVPGVKYDSSNNSISVTAPQGVVFRFTIPLMVDPKIADIQTKLTKHGFDVGHIDGVFGAKTQAAVVAFQNSVGLVPDGEVGKATEMALAL